MYIYPCAYLYIYIYIFIYMESAAVAYSAVAAADFFSKFTKLCF